LLNKVSYLKEGTSIEGLWENIPTISVLKIQNTVAELKKKMHNKRETVNKFYFLTIQIMG
jgi:hypothetical protein